MTHYNREKNVKDDYNVRLKEDSMSIHKVLEVRKHRISRMFVFLFHVAHNLISLLLCGRQFSVLERLKHRLW